MSTETETSKLSVGYIGLGRMGGPMADNLLRKGFRLGVFDVSEAALASRVEAGALRYASPVELAANCDLLFTCLPGPKQSERVMLGDEGVIKGIRPGAICVECTTNSPDTIRRLGEQLTQAGAQLIEACVSGGPWNSAAGTLVMMLGGDQEVIARAQPALDAVATRFHATGELGSGTVAKLVHNMIHNVTVQVAVEGVAMAIKSGIDSAVMLDIIRNGAVGQAAAHHQILARMVDGAPLGSQFFPLELSYKDISLATAQARQVQAPLTFAAIAEQNLLEIMARRLGGRDNRVLAETLALRAGVAQGVLSVAARAATPADTE